MRAPDGNVVAQASSHEAGYQWGLERFLLEARTLAKFSHPHIVRVLRYFEANSTAYMVMDYEKGDPPKTVLQHDPQPAEALLKALIAPLLVGLAAVHATGFLHRDIKPDNIFIRANGSPVLIDFGAARQALGGETKSLTANLQESAKVEAAPVEASKVEISRPKPVPPAVQRPKPPAAKLAEENVPEPLRKYRQETEAEFRSGDTNGDGHISRVEAQARFPALARAFARVDTDGDGRISPQEFFQARRIMLERRLGKQ